MGNSDLQAAWDYHRRTNHSPASVQASVHWLDWANLPRPYKLYPTLPALPLPTERPESDLPALAAIASQGATRSKERTATLAELSTVLHYSAGVTKRLKFPGGEMDFRAAACTGALYHIDLYLACAELPGLAAGVYHYGPHDDALRLLRPGDPRAALLDACGGQEWVARAPASLIYTATYWRNAWKYRERAYRHAFWDSGTILANTLALAAAHELPTGVVMGFVDRALNRLLDLNPQKEVALLVAPLGYTPNPPPPSAGPIGPLELPTTPYSAAEVDYPAIRAIHTASSLSTPGDVQTWRRAAEASQSLDRSQEARAPHQTTGPSPEHGRQTGAQRQPEGSPSPMHESPRPIANAQDEGGEIPLPLRGRGTGAQRQGEGPPTPIETIIRSRGSARRFQRTPISYEALSTILSCATRGFEADYRAEPARALAECFLLVNAVEGLAPGAYRYPPGGDRLELLRPGEFRDAAGHLALDQQLAADAAVNVYFLAHVPGILETLGNRGYRAAQLDASVMAGKIYLAAYALQLGATGLTFYDDEVTRFFGPPAADRSPMFLVALGNPAPRHSAHPPPAYTDS